MLNPNSYLNISNILRNIGKRAGIEDYCSEGERKWIYLENDATIYMIVNKLIRKVLKCSECSESFYGISKF